MNFYQKYLKYKKKYVDLKNQYDNINQEQNQLGGGISQDDIIEYILDYSNIDILRIIINKIRQEFSNDKYNYIRLRFADKLSFDLFDESIDELFKQNDKDKTITLQFNYKPTKDSDYTKKMNIDIEYDDSYANIFNNIFEYDITDKNIKNDIVDNILSKKLNPKIYKTIEKDTIKIVNRKMVFSNNYAVEFANCLFNMLSDLVYGNENYNYIKSILKYYCSQDSRITLQYILENYYFYVSIIQIIKKISKDESNLNQLNTFISDSVNNYIHDLIVCDLNNISPDYSNIINEKYLLVKNIIEKYLGQIKNILEAEVFNILENINEQSETTPENKQEKIKEIYELYKKYDNTTKNLTPIKYLLFPFIGNIKELKVYGRCLIIIPSTIKGSQFYGRGTKWCTAALGNNMFEHYDRIGDIYLMMDLLGKNNKYQMHYDKRQGTQLQNIKDSPFPLNELLNLYGELFWMIFDNDNNEIYYEYNMNKHINLKLIDIDAVCEKNIISSAYDVANLCLNKNLIKYGVHKFITNYIDKYVNVSNINNNIRITGNSNYECSLLYVACTTGNLEFVKSLMKFKPNVNIRDSTGATILFPLCEKNYLEILNFILDTDIDVNNKNNNEDTILMYACSYFNFDAIELLFNKKPNIDVNIQNKVKNTALIESCEFGEVDLIKLFGAM